MSSMSKLSNLAYSLIVLAFAGCGGSKADSPADQLAKESIKLSSDYADGLEKNPPANQDEFIQRRKEFRNGKHELGKRLKALNLSDDASQNLRKKYDDQLDKMGKRVLESERKVFADLGKRNRRG